MQGLQLLVQIWIHIPTTRSRGTEVPLFRGKGRCTSAKRFPCCETPRPSGSVLHGKYRDGVLHDPMEKDRPVGLVDLAL